MREMYTSSAVGKCLQGRRSEEYVKREGCEGIMMTARQVYAHRHTLAYTQADARSHLEAYKHEVDNLAKESARHQQRKNSFKLNTESQEGEVKYFLHT